MEDFQAQFSNGLPTIDGGTSLRQTLAPYVTQSALEYQLQDFTQNITTGVFELPTFSELSQLKKADSYIDANNQRIQNLATVDISSIDAILATPSSAVNVSTMTSYNTFNVPLQIASLSNIILPLSTTTSMKTRTIINAGDPRPYGENSTPADIVERLQDVVTVGHMNRNTLKRDVTDSEDIFYAANNEPLRQLANATIYKDDDTYDVTADPLEPDVFNRVLNQNRLEKLKKTAVNLGVLQDNTISLDTASRTSFDAKGKLIYGVLTDDLTNLDHINFHSGNVSTQVQKKISQAINIKYALNNCLHSADRDPLDLTAPPLDAAYDALGNNIQNGRAAVLPNDFVILDQALVKEEEKLHYELSNEVRVEPSYDHVSFEDSGTVYTCKDPSLPPTSAGMNFRHEYSAPPKYTPNNRQLANLKYVDNKVEEEVKKRHKKGEDLDLEGFRITNVGVPRLSGPFDNVGILDVVNRGYCDKNSARNIDGTGAISGIFGGVLGGVFGSVLTNTLGQGLQGIGSISGALSAVSGLANGLSVGSAADLARLGTNLPAGDSKQLIDNAVDDALNGGNPAEGGSVMQGSLNISGLLSAVRNASIGLFQV